MNSCGLIITLHANGRFDENMKNKNSNSTSQIFKWLVIIIFDVLAIISKQRTVFNKNVDLIQTKQKTENKNEMRK